MKVFQGRLLALVVLLGLGAPAGVIAGGVAASATPVYTVTATIAVGTNPEGVGVDPSTHTVYVANGGGNTVSVIDGTTNTVTATIPVGTNPTGVGVDPSTHTVYVTNLGRNTVSVIDGATNTVTATINVGSRTVRGGRRPVHPHRLRRQPGATRCR